MSPKLFIVYMDALSLLLNNTNIGGTLNGKLSHISYADDLCLLSISSACMQRLLNICEEYGVIIIIIMVCLSGLSDRATFGGATRCFWSVDCVWLLFWFNCAMDLFIISVVCLRLLVYSSKMFSFVYSFVRGV